MADKKSFWKRFKSDPLTHLAGALSIFYGLAFVAAQTTRLFRPEAAEAAMAKTPYGLFDWGFVWADTVVIVPLFIAGGILLLWKSSNPLGPVFAFSAFSMNLYATIFFIIGLDAAGKPMSVGALALNSCLAFLGMLAMVWLCIALARPRSA